VVVQAERKRAHRTRMLRFMRGSGKR